MNFEENVLGSASLPDKEIYISLTGLNYSSKFLFYYEKKYFNETYINLKQLWMFKNWYMSVFYALIYIIAIFTGQYLMKSRPKFDLRRALIAWNVLLALFSTVGAIRVWPEFIRTLSLHGIDHSICSKDYAHGVSGCWAWLFILSKVPELLDTAFIVLRKQKLIFLHWYHHATVLIYCWYSTSDFSSSGRWFMLMNYTVHAFMYTYYAFRALRFKIPKWVNIAITSSQISQMVFGIYVNCIAYLKKSRGEPCGVSNENIYVSFLMYFSYFLLFFKFFHSAYISSKKKQSAMAIKTKEHQTMNGTLTNGYVKQKFSENNKGYLYSQNKDQHNKKEE